MTAISKNLYINKRTRLVTEYKKPIQRSIKMNPIIVELKTDFPSK